jgi:hypothetical protein
MRTALLLRVQKTAEEALQRAIEAGGGSGGGGGGNPPLPVATRIIFVNKGGNDATGTGTIDAPYLTLTKALASTDNAGGWSIQVGPGSYGDSLALKSGVSFTAIEPEGTILTGVMSIGPGFGNFGSASFSNFQFTQSQTFNWGAVQTPTLFLFNCEFDDNLTILGGAGLGSTLSLTFCNILGTLSLTNVNTIYTQGNDIQSNVNVTATAFQAFWSSNGDSIGTNGGVTPNVMTATGAFILQAILVGTQLLTPLTLDGANTSYRGTAGAIPPVVVLAGGAAAPILLSGANGLQYTATTVANWSGANPTSIQNALDRIAAKITPIP